MPWSSSNQYKDREPHLTSNECSQALSAFFLAPVDLSIATEASSHPSGLRSLFGQPYVYAGGGLGNMDECPLQVCLAGGTARNSLTFASVCVPEGCDALDLAADDFAEKVKLSSEASVDPELAEEYHVLNARIAELNKFLGTGWTCGEYNVPFRFFPFGGLYLMLFTLLLATTATATFWKRRRSSTSTRTRTHSHFQEKPVDPLLSPEQDSLLRGNERQKETKESSPQLDVPVREKGYLFRHLMSDWNVWSNIRKLFVRRDATACLDGLRVLSMFWIILGHVMAIQSSSGGGYSNPKEFLPPDGLTTKLPGQLLFASRFAVDTFLFISGFLVVRVMCAKMPRSEEQNFGWRYLSTVPGLLFHRLLRILPLYGMSLGFWTEIAPQLGSGPFWYQWESFLAPCRLFGWTNWLFVNNFFPWDMPNVETCFYHSWYLAVDLQLFIVAPLLVFWYQQFPKEGKIATATLMASSILITMALSFLRKWSINTFDGAAVARFDVEAYAKPHIRGQTYIAGMLLGMILQDRILSLRVTVKTRLAMAAAIITLFVVTFITVTGAYSRRACRYEEWPELSDCGSTWTSGQTFWYTATSRPFWALSIAVICYLCLQGAGGLVNDFLSHPFWTPLSHLTFGAYLVHPIVIFVYQFGDRQKEPFRMSTFLLDYLSMSMVSFGFSLLLALIVELPCANVSKRLFSRKRFDQRPVDTEELLSAGESNGKKYGSILM